MEEGGRLLPPASTDFDAKHHKAAAEFGVGTPLGQTDEVERGPGLTRGGEGRDGSVPQGQPVCNDPDAEFVAWSGMAAVPFTNHVQWHDPPGPRAHKEKLKNSVENRHAQRGKSSAIGHPLPSTHISSATRYFIMSNNVNPIILNLQYW